MDWSVHVSFRVGKTPERLMTSFCWWSDSSLHGRFFSEGGPTTKMGTFSGLRPVLYNFVLSPIRDSKTNLQPGLIINFGFTLKNRHWVVIFIIISSFISLSRAQQVIFCSSRIYVRSYSIKSFRHHQFQVYNTGYFVRAAFRIKMIKTRLNQNLSSFKTAKVSIKLEGKEE